MAQQRRQLSVAGKQGSCNSKLFFTTSAHATSGRGFLRLRKCLKCTLHTEVLPNGETTYTLESSVSSLTIQNTTNSTRNQIQPEKKRTSGEHPLFEVGSLLQPGNVAMHLSAPTTRSLRPAAAETPTLFFLFVENSRGLHIFTQHKSRFHHSPRPEYP